MQEEIEKVPHLVEIFSRGDLECVATSLINEDYWCDYNGTTHRDERRRGGNTELNA